MASDLVLLVDPVGGYANRRAGPGGKRAGYALQRAAGIASWEFGWAVDGGSVDRGK